MATIELSAGAAPQDLERWLERLAMRRDVSGARAALWVEGERRLEVGDRDGFWNLVLGVVAAIGTTDTELARAVRSPTPPPARDDLRWLARALGEAGDRVPTSSRGHSRRSSS